MDFTGLSGRKHDSSRLKSRICLDRFERCQTAARFKMTGGSLKRQKLKRPAVINTPAHRMGLSSVRATATECIFYMTLKLFNTKPCPYLHSGTFDSCFASKIQNIWRLQQLIVVCMFSARVLLLVPLRCHLFYLCCVCVMSVLL